MDDDWCDAELVSNYYYSFLQRIAALVRMAVEHQFN